MSVVDEDLEVQTVNSNSYSDKTSRMSLYFIHYISEYVFKLLIHLYVCIQVL